MPNITEAGRIVWNRDRDPAAVSVWRSRAVFERGGIGGKQYELVVYDTGDWYIYSPSIPHSPTMSANGREDDGKTAMARCMRVLEALISEV